jgi:biopolymer transport protein ExbD
VNTGKRKKRRPFLPINAMSDIAFLLLIFIMLIALVNYRKEIKIEYPEAETLEGTNADSNLEIWITSDGDIFQNGNLVDKITLEGIIVDAIIDNPSTRIHILADRDTPYRHINGVFELLQLLQHRVVSLVVKEKGEQ